jgi:hypothetical protein
MEFKAALERNEEPSSNLKAWIIRQKYQHKLKQRGNHSLITDERVQKLEELGVSFETIREHDFHVRYNQLKEFVRKNDGLFPYDLKSHNDKLGQELSGWCQNQRTQYNQMLAGKKSRLTQEQMDLLNQIGFTWKARDSLWGYMYNELKNFVAEHDHFFVRDYVKCPPLERWCDNQRQNYRLLKKFGTHPSMTPQRFQLLNKIGFPWESWEVRWDENYRDLVRYVKIHGSETLPKFSDKEFGKVRYWLRHQNNHYQKFVRGEMSSMTPLRIKLLDEKLGSLWRPRNSEEGALPVYLRSED